MFEPKNELASTGQWDFPPMNEAQMPGLDDAKKSPLKDEPLPQNQSPDQSLALREEVEALKRQLQEKESDLENTRNQMLASVSMVKELESANMTYKMEVLKTKELL
jgi:molecular chaperone GrpE (heat shock protein)